MEAQNPSETTITTVRAHRSDPKHYAAIVDAARRVGWPTHFASDISSWDRAMLCGKGIDGCTLPGVPLEPTEPFAWILRETGTHLIAFMRPSRAKAMTAAMVSDAFGEHECRYFGWDGRELRLFESSEALDAWIAETKDAAGELGEHR